MQNRFKLLLKSIYDKGFFHLLSANVLIGLIGFGSQLLVARFLDPAEIAQIRILQSYIQIGTLIASFGFTSALLKLCSEDIPLSQKRRIFRQTLIYTFYPMIFVLSLFGFLAYAQLLSPDPRVNFLLPLFMLVIPARTINNLIIHYLQALKKIQLMARLQATIRITGFLLILILTWQYKIIGFIIASLIAAWAVLVVLSRTVYQDLKKQTQSRTTEPRILTYGQWAVAIMVLGTLSQYMDIFMLNFLENDRISFGYYSLATLFIIGLNFFTETVQSIATPYFSEKEKNRREFIRVLRKYTLLLITLAGLVTLVANLCLPAFIVWFYGSAYHSVSTFFRLLSLKYLLWSAYALTGIATFGLGKIHLNFASAIIILPISVALNWHFIHSAGVTGAAWAQVYTAAIAFLLNWTILLYALKQTVKTDNSAAEVDNKQ